MVKTKGGRATYWVEDGMVFFSRQALLDYRASK